MIALFGYRFYMGAGCVPRICSTERGNKLAIVNMASIIAQYGISPVVGSNSIVCMLAHKTASGHGKKLQSLSGCGLLANCGCISWSVMFRDVDGRTCFHLRIQLPGWTKMMPVAENACCSRRQRGTRRWGLSVWRCGSNIGRGWWSVTVFFDRGLAEASRASGWSVGLFLVSSHDGWRLCGSETGAPCYPGVIGVIWRKNGWWENSMSKHPAERQNQLALKEITKIEERRRRKKRRQERERRFKEYRQA